MTDQNNGKLPSIEINLDRIAHRAKLGVTRAAVFMGLGLHAAYREDLRDYQLHKLPVVEGQTSFAIDLVPHDVTEDTLADFKREFGTWIVGCGLRELLEHYAMAVDQAHTLGVFILHRLGKAEPLGAHPAKVQKDFHAFGLPKKLELLNARLGITPNFPDHIASLYKGRNCLAHGGVANARNADHNGELTLRWRAPEIWAENRKTGVKLVGQAMIGRTLPEGADIMIGVADRAKTYKVSEPIKLSQQDLWEICYFFASDCIPSLTHSMITCFEGLGVPVVRVKEPKLNVKVRGTPRRPA